MQYFLDVVLPIPLERFFTYRISKEEADFLKPGMRVAVPFGKSKIYTALSYRVHQNPPEAYEAKEIHQILDEVPLVNEIQLKHWQWIADYYMCTLGEVLRGALPSAFLLESETLILPNRSSEIDENDLKDDEFLVYEALQHHESLKIDDISGIIDRKSALPVITRLLRKGVIVLKEELYEQYKPKLVRYVKIASQYQKDETLELLLNQLSRAPKQSQVVMALFQLQATIKKPIKVKDLMAKSGATSSVIKALIDKNIFEEYYLQQDRVVFETDASKKEVELNRVQTEAYQNILEGFAARKPVLLHGVTASGKTEVYVKLIETIIKKGKQVLYLLPEIALTPQLIVRLQGFFGDKVVVFHSKYSLNERVEVWNNVLLQKQKAQIVIGARSALFLPFSKLGLIVIDEEHESSFKQFDPAPRYHARDAAMVLAKLHGCDTVLGSATPSIESMHNVKTDKYGYAEINERYGKVLMPEIELVDLKEATKKKLMKGHFSERLLNEINSALQLGEQIILFQNRRGFAPIVECTTCGHSPQCPNCDVSLTFHQYQNQLRCHYCGYHMVLDESCVACGSFTLDKKGFGTEQVQQELKEHLPDFEIGRMDLDTTRGKHGYEKIITAFEQQEFDVLVGTQMVTKGLDFRNVGLVGIMNADTLLNFPDYRAHERSFQLLTQVAGRAGRTKKRGKVLIQTYNPYHRILQQVTDNDYAAMFNDQSYEREHFAYPPSTKIIKVTLKDKDFNKLNESSLWFSDALRNLLPNHRILGPEFPPISRIRRYYLKNILIKMAEGQSPSKIKNGIKRIEKSFNAISQYKSVRLVYNVDHI
ncbi:primosomal protein N' [Allomuricauda sp. d1]|uniref:replication restart helicase PriA n=1 Tax=Allomuricauda sp. d1 TaxID=3136725 RepID=UPI0031CF5D66